MKKKLFFTTILATLLSFGMMAKTDVKTSKFNKTVKVKTVHHRQNKQSVKLYGCISVTLSCGIRGWACGETLVEAIDNAIWADGLLCP